MPSKPSEDRSLDHYPPLKQASEEALFSGYRNMPRHRIRIVPDALWGTVEPIYDESGLLYGEPLSKGRADGLRRRQR